VARNQTSIEAPPEAVWDVLADPGSYSEWVVGSKDMRGVEGDWPEPASLFHHTQATWPFPIKDTTSALVAERPRRLKLEVRARPLVVGHVEMLIEPEGRGSRVTMIEEPVGAILGVLRNPVLDRLIQLRNAESLRRLRRLAERRAASSTAAPRRAGRASAA
jgi:uncharacterized protein YndB with AHSA1/START domain